MNAEERLRALRARIDQIDGQLAPLLAERMDVAERVAEIKGEAGLPVLDEDRERQVITRASALAGERFDRDVSELMRAVLASSRSRQREILRRDGDGHNTNGKPAKRIAVLNGPNLNLLGAREPDKYGRTTLSELNALVLAKAAERGVRCSFFQSNGEGELIDAVQKARDCDGVILNAGACTHYSLALRDAIAAIETPVIEVHLTNTAARESFRRRSVIAPVCRGGIAGFGPTSYVLALYALIDILEHKTNPAVVDESTAKALALIGGGSVSCVVMQNGAAVYTAEGRGVSPLLRLYESEPEKLKDALVVDRVVGKAAAMILVLGGAARAYGVVMSAAGRAYLERHGVEAAYGRCVDCISNRDRSDVCPIEKSVLAVDDPRAGLDAMKTAMDDLMKRR